MLTSLTRLRRLRAGWIVALIYLLCVLAPTISFALPGSQAASPCLIDTSHAPGTVHVHNDVPAPHIHKDGHTHDHSGASSQTNFGEDHSISMAQNGKLVPQKAPHSSDGQCCGLTCVSALSTALIEIVKPSAPMALCEIEGHRKVSDSAPARHYRPPIS